MKTANKTVDDEEAIKILQEVEGIGTEATYHYHVKQFGKEIQPTLERIEQKMVQNQHQETPEFKAIQQKMESLQPPTPPIPKTPKLPGL